MTCPRTDQSPAHGINRWHWLTILAGLMLTITFCMNVFGFQFIVSPNHSDFSPLSLGIAVMREHAKTPLVPLTSRVFILPAAGMGMIVLPHLLGLIMALYSAAWLGGTDRLKKTIHICGITLGTVCGLFSAGVFASGVPAKVVKIFGGSYPLAMGGFFIMTLTLWVIPLLVLLYALLAMRRGSRAYLYHGFIGAAVTLSLCAHSVGGLNSWSDLLGGAGLSFAASCLLFVARVGEARAITRLSWRRTLAYLLVLRLHKALPSGGLCPGCGYNLYGLCDMRCPECGRPFTFDELGTAPEAIGYTQALSGDPEGTR